MDAATVSPLVRRHLDAWLPQDAVVLTYLPMPGEVAPGPSPADRILLVTRTPDDGPLSVHRLGGPLERHRLGFEQPADGSPGWVDAVDVVLLPGLAFGRDGSRLGRGTGHFDRLLGALDIPLRVGVAAEVAVVDRVPTEAHDAMLTHLVTEEGLRAVG